MTTLTIPKELRNKELVLIPRDEYEQLVEYRQNNAWVAEEIEPSSGVKRSFARARKNLKLGKTLSVHELKRKLGY